MPRSPLAAETGASVVRPRIAALTGLRAVAAFAVIVTHAAFWSGDFTPDVWGAAYARLEVAVPVFFALSGFLLIRPWVAAARGQRAPVDVRRYFASRAWRVLPAYWAVVTAVYVLFIWRDNPSDSGQGIGGYLQHLAFVQLYQADQVHTGLVHLWSMAVEVVYYLLLPLIGALLVRYPRRTTVVPLAMVAVTVVWLVIASETDLLGATARTWPPAYGAAFGAGITVALVIDRVRWSRPTRWALLGAAVVAYAILLTPAAGPIDLQEPTAIEGITKYLLAALIGGTLVAWAASGPARLLGSRVMVWLGDISYEVFLIHVIVMDIVVLDLLGWTLFQGSTWPIVALTTAITVPLAWLLHRAVNAVRDVRWRPPRFRSAAAQ